MGGQAEQEETSLDMSTSRQVNSRDLISERGFSNPTTTTVRKQDQVVKNDQDEAVKKNPIPIIPSDEAATKPGVASGSFPYESHHQNERTARTSRSSFDEQQRNDEFAIGSFEFDESARKVIAKWSVNDTSVHGLSYIFESHFVLWHRIFWIVLVLFATSLLLWQIFALVNSFSDFAVNTSIQDNFPPYLEFPHVTICNTQPLRQERIAQFLGINNTNNAGTENDGDIEELLAQKKFTPRNLTELFAVSQTAEELFLYSRFGSTADFLDADLWRPVLTEVGICFRFENNATTNEFLDEAIDSNIVAFSGMASGLSLIVNLSQSSYPSNQIPFAAGLYVYVTKPGTPIVYGSPFILCRPGRSQSISLRPTTIRRETRTPWKNCRNEAGYTQEACRASCFNRKLEQQCRCTGVGIPPLFDGNNKNNISMTTAILTSETIPDLERKLPFCPPTILTDNSTCNNLTVSLEECNCQQPPCVETSFDTRFSSVSFSQQELRRTLESNNATANYSVEDIENDIVHVTINFEAIRSRTIQESPAMTITQLLAGIGGQMGLFLGISVISLFEVVGELSLVRLLFHAE